MTEKVEQKSFGATLAAAAVDRLFVPRRDGGLMPRRRFLVFLLICLLLHFSLLAFLLWSDWLAAKNAPPLVEEIPVEVITEPPPAPPPPPPEPPKPEPEQQQKPPPPPPPPKIEEDPAFDAPKAASKTDSKLDTDAPEEKQKAPREDKPTDKVAPKDDKPQGLKDAKDDSGDAKPAEAAVEKKTDDKPDAEIIERAQETPKPPDTPNAPEAQKAKKGEAMSIADQIAAMTPLPDFKLRAPPKKSPVGGGQAKTTYLTILYGLIMPHMRIPPSARAVGGTEKGIIAFYIDETGNLTHQAVYRSSGLPELDAAALAAVRRAAPFPPPPAGLPHSMLFSYATK
jgi:protein TonB